jgi:hypothetical protein
MGCRFTDAVYCSLLGIHMSEADAAGRGLRLTGMVLMVLGMLLYAVLGDPEENPAALLGPFISIAGGFVYYRGRQLAAKASAVAPESAITDSKPDVLYLRSFRADRRQAWITNEEDQLADVLRPFGDLIAIGRPGERLPTPGATRMYVADTDWQATILDRMRIAPLVVIRAGVGQGLFWELGQAITTLDPERMLILVLDISANDYAAFAAQAQTVLGLSLPALERFGLMNSVVNYRENPSRLRPGFISFSSDWTPEFLPIRTTIVRTGYNDLRKSFDVALRPVFERNRVDWRPIGRF